MGDVSSVCAIGSTLLRNIKGEDNVMVLLNFKQGAIGELDVSWTYKGYQISAEILGSTGGIFVGTPSLPITVYTEKGIPTVLKGSIHPQPPTTLAEMMAYQKKKVENFIESIAADKEPIVTGEDGRAALEVMLAAYKSMKTGKKIDLPLK